MFQRPTHCDSETAHHDDQDQGDEFGYLANFHGVLQSEVPDELQFITGLLQLYDTRTVVMQV